MSPPVNGRTCARQGGFTLLEMVVVVTVLGFLIIGLTQGVRTGLTLWEAQSRRVGETAELDAATRLLPALLSGIAPPPSFRPAPPAARGAELNGGAPSPALLGAPPAR